MGNAREPIRSVEIGAQADGTASGACRSIF